MSIFRPIAGNHLLAGGDGHIALGVQLAGLGFAGAVGLLHLGIENRHDIAPDLLAAAHRIDIAPENRLLVGIDDFHFIGFHLNGRRDLLGGMQGGRQKAKNEG